jgi:Ca2+-binding EF-hand superfamily protein
MFVDMLMDQIDLNRDGKVSFQELTDFLFPQVPVPVSVSVSVSSSSSSSKTAQGQAQGQTQVQSQEPQGQVDKNSSSNSNSNSNSNSLSIARLVEPGVMMHYTRKMLVKLVNTAALTAAATSSSEDTALEVVAGLAKTKLKKSGQIDLHTLSKAFHSLGDIPELGRTLSEDEVKLIVRSLDQNNDQIVTAREFKFWLSQSHGHSKESLAALQPLFSLIKEKFRGDLKLFFSAVDTLG